MRAEARVIDPCQVKRLLDEPVPIISICHYKTGSHPLQHKLLMKLAPQEVIHKLPLLWLIIHPSRLISEDQIIVPPSFHRECGGRGRGGGCTRCGRGLAECGSEVEQGVAGGEFGIAVPSVCGV